MSASMLLKKKPQTHKSAKQNLLQHCVASRIVLSAHIGSGFRNLWTWRTPRPQCAIYQRKPSLLLRRHVSRNSSCCIFRDSVKPLRDYFPNSQASKKKWGDGGVSKASKFRSPPQKRRIRIKFSNYQRYRCALQPIELLIHLYARA